MVQTTTILTLLNNNFLRGLPRFVDNFCKLASPGLTIWVASKIHGQNGFLEIRFINSGWI